MKEKLFAALRAAAAENLIPWICCEERPNLRASYLVTLQALAAPSAQPGERAVP